MRARDRRRARVERLRALRDQADERLGERDNVIGSMIALKQVAGQTTGRLGLTVLVKEKIPLDDIPPKQRVPGTMTLSDERFATDVLIWPRMVEQALTAGYIISDQLRQGTLSCFARTELGLFGLTCGHCLFGIDGSPTTPTPVQVYVPGKGFLPLGESVISIFAPAHNGPGGYGYVDCGLLSLSGPMMTRAVQARPLTVATGDGALLGAVLQGYSMLQPGPGVPPVRQARIVGIDKWAIDERADLVIEVAPPGTFAGDSGLLWRTADGRAAAIHCRGEHVPALNGSRLTTAMSARRAADLLGVTLLWD